MEHQQTALPASKPESAIPTCIGKVPAWQVLCAAVQEGCTGCGRCVRECRYLQENGHPGRQAGAMLDAILDPAVATACSLCSLCTALCPEPIDPGMMFRSLRNEAHRRDGDLGSHCRLRTYERMGRSPLLSWHGLPIGCDTVFFPGCGLAGTRPHRVREVFALLRSRIQNLGVVLDCCGKPSLDLGRIGSFNRSMDFLVKALRTEGVRRVLVACPSCLQAFSCYADELDVETVYAHLPDRGSAPLGTTVVVHDPCSVRERAEVHRDVRRVTAACGVRIEEMSHAGEQTLCCGEGGAVACLRADFSGQWTVRRSHEAGARPVMTYCSGCVGFLSGSVSVFHLLDFYFEPKAALTGRSRWNRAPWTYVARFLLKRELRALIRPARSGRRRPDGSIRIRRHRG